MAMHQSDAGFQEINSQHTIKYIIHIYIYIYILYTTCEK